MNRVRRLSNAAKLNVAGLVVTAAAMLLQIAAGSELYPSFAGPIVLLAAAVVVAFWSSRWTAYVGLLVPLVLGLGAIIAALMSGEFIKQLTDVGNAGIFLGSLMHVIGLIAAVAGAIGMLRGRPAADERER
jgi:Mg/Co/Ni transporter MgtE